MTKEYLADKQTLDSVNSKVGTSGDSGSASVFAKLNSITNAIANHVAAWTAARANNLDTTISSRAPANTALSNGVWTNTRAGYLDYLANGTYGLNAIKNEVTAAKNAAGGIALGSAIRIIHAYIKDSQTFSGTGKGILFIYSTSPSVCPAINIDGRQTGNIMGAYQGGFVEIQFLENFSVTSSVTADDTFCNVVFY